MTNRTRLTFATLALVAAAGLSACKNNDAENTTAVAKATPMNMTCPMTGEKVDAKVTSTHEGKTIAFCCAGCKSKFDKMDDAHQDAVCAKAK